MSQPGEDMFEKIFGEKSFRAPIPEPILPPGDYCVKCKKILVMLPVLTPGGDRSLFYCNNHSCERFGILTVVTKRIK